MTWPEDRLWPLLTYAESLSVVAGETLRICVSSVPDRFDAQLVRLGVPGRPRLEEHLQSTVDGAYPGRVQPLHAGSYVRTLPVADMMQASFTVQAWICPTLVGEGLQTILSQGRSGDLGWALELDEQGRLRLRQWRSASERILARSSVRLASHSWYFVAAVVDLERLLARVHVVAVAPWRSGDDAAIEEQSLAQESFGDRSANSLASIWMAACQTQEGGWGSAVLNGKIEAPRLFRAAISEHALSLLAAGASPMEIAPGKVAGAWDMSVAMDSVHVLDRSPAGAHGTCVNMPARAVTGHRFAGQALGPQEDPRLYGAIHFHDDDLADAGWAPDIELPIGDELASGLYAIKLTSGEDRAYAPFYVRPAVGRPRAPALFLAPTNTYLAYANNRLVLTDAEGVAARGETPLQAIDSFTAAHPALGGSLYDTHRDGSGICYASARRPMPNIDPTYVDGLLERPRHFAADLHLLTWLAKHGHQVDVATDHDLHREGTELLAPYRVLLTGSHPEYHSSAMLDGLQEHMKRGGNVMYLGGNGFYWVTSFHPELPHVIEVRRGFSGTRSWQVAEGEEHHSSTGEKGGLWRHRGRGANRFVGVGSVGHGFPPGVGYRRLPDSGDPRMSFVFEGVENEQFGDFSSDLVGAAGDEVDASDVALGTPAHAAVLACSEILAGYFPMLDEELVYSPSRLGEHNPRIRSEIVYFETGAGGAVFSVGSINWCLALAHNDYDNDVSRITGNVLRAFLAA